MPTSAVPGNTTLLSATARAQSAKNYLVALGVKPNRVRTVSYGKERPAVAGHSEQAWGAEPPLGHGTEITARPRAA